MSIAGEKLLLSPKSKRALFSGLDIKLKKKKNKHLQGITNENKQLSSNGMTEYKL